MKTKIVSLRLGGNKMKIVFLRYNCNAFTVYFEEQRVLKNKRERMLISTYDPDYNSVMKARCLPTIM